MAPPKTLPAGFNPIPAGQVLYGPHKGEKIEAFGFKVTPVTNAEWRAAATRLGGDRYILLEHDWSVTGETKFLKKGKTAEEALGGPAYIPEEIKFDKGDVMVFGSFILVKMVDDPSAQYDEGNKIFSGAKQPVVGISYFHATAWCLLKTLESGGKFKYNLPTEAEYEYVDDQDTAYWVEECRPESRTEKCTLERQELRYVYDYFSSELEGKVDAWGAPGVVDPWVTTRNVDDSRPRYTHKLPFGVQTKGNVERWIKMSAQFKEGKSYYKDPNGSTGFWGLAPTPGFYTFIGYTPPVNNYEYIGFSPVVVLLD